MNRVPRPLDLSWNEETREHGAVVVTHQPGPRWISWLSAGMALFTFVIALRVAGFHGNSIISVADLLFWGISGSLMILAMRAANDKTLTISNRTLSLSQRLEPRRRSVSATDVERISIRQHGTGWDLCAHSGRGDAILPFRFRSVAHAEYAASRIAQHSGADFTSDPTHESAFGGKRCEQEITATGAVLRYRDLHPANAFGAFMAWLVFLLNVSMVGLGTHMSIALPLLFGFNAMLMTAMGALKTRLVISPHSLSVSHPLSFGRGPKVQGTIQSFTVRKDFLTWTVVAFTSDGNATPIGMFSRKESDARATAETLNEVLRSVRSNAATGYRVGSLAPAARVALPDHSADPTEEPSTKQRGA